MAGTDSPSDRIEPPFNSRPLPPPTGEALYYITPEEGGAADIEAMWLAEDFLAEAEGRDAWDR